MWLTFIFFFPPYDSPHFMRGEKSEYIVSSKNNYLPGIRAVLKGEIAIVLTSSGDFKSNLEHVVMTRKYTIWRETHHTLIPVSDFQDRIPHCYS